MPELQLRIVVLGLSITSSWGNGHATNFRGLVKALTMGGHDVLFLERDVPWYAAHRDLPAPPYGETALYESSRELRDCFARAVAEADLVIVGSFVPEGVAVAEWALAVARGAVGFYDIDTPVTLAAVEAGHCDYLTRQLIPQFDLYLSFTGGPTLTRLEQQFGARRAVPFYCLVDPDLYQPVAAVEPFDLGYLGTYSADRQPMLDELLLEPARRQPERRFVVAGPQYPDSIAWPHNVRRIDHVPPDRHPAFYASQRFTLNVTREDMKRSGWSPSVRLFEAAACGAPVISDRWDGLDQFFTPGREILLANDARDVLAVLEQCGEEERRLLAERARARVLREHTAEHRAVELEQAFLTAVGATR